MHRVVVWGVQRKGPITRRGDRDPARPGAMGCGNVIASPRVASQHIMQQGRAGLHITSHRAAPSSMSPTVLCMLLMVAALLGPGPGVLARRGRAKARSRSRMQIGLPVTGKYRDPESDQYYNHSGGAKIIQASHFDFEYTLGHKISFVCVAKGSPRPHITWFKDGVELYAHLFTTVHEYILDKDFIKSKLEIDPATQMDAGVYECTADNMYAIDRRSFKTDFSIIFD